MIAITCQCGKTYQVEERLAGQTVRCRGCGAALSIPKPVAAAGDVPKNDRGKAPPTADAAVGESHREFESRGRYSVGRAIGKGGMGRISIARDVLLKRNVALKELREDRAASSHSRQRFIAEAEITGQLEHPGVVPIYAIGRDSDGKPFYAMKLIEGQTLTEAIAEYHKSRRPIELKNLLRRFIGVCHAVAYAHNRGIIHRDLKPPNIMLGAFGETLVMDWGLAKPVWDGRSESSTMGDVAERQLADGVDEATHGAVGTAAYMAPEQAFDDANTLRATADVYGLGAVLYHMLTGKPPYSGSSVEVMKKLKAGPPPKPSDANAAVPRALEAICLKAMARCPTDRYQSAIGLADSVQRWLDDEPVDAYPEPLRERLYRWSRKHKAIVVSGTITLLTILIVGSIATVLYQRERDKAQAARRLGDDYLQKATEAERLADEREAKANRLAAEAEASRREMIDALKKEAEATHAVNVANEKIAALQADIAGNVKANQDVQRELEAARSGLVAAQDRVKVEAGRADKAADRAASLDREIVGLRREAEEYRELARGLANLVGPLLNNQAAVQVQQNTPWDDFAQRDAVLFDIGGNDRSEGTATSDSTRVRSGRQSIRVSAKRSGSISVTYPRSRNANWDLSPFEYMTLAFMVESEGGAGFRNGNLLVRIGRDSQCIEYSATSESFGTVPNGWTFVKVPLAGDSAWKKREVNSLNPLNLSRVDWLQICFQTTSQMTNVWLDELSFGADPRKAGRTAASDVNRMVTEYVLAIDGKVTAWVSGKTIEIKAMSEIPKDPFQVVEIWSGDKEYNVNMNDGALKLFSALPNCRTLGVVGGSFTDEGLRHLAEMKSLVWLGIPGSRVTDAGIAALVTMPNLTGVMLDDVSVSEIGLRELKRLPAGLHEVGVSANRFPKGIAFLKDCPLETVKISVDKAQGGISDGFVESLLQLRGIRLLNLINVFLTETQAKRIGEMRELVHITLFDSSGVTRPFANLTYVSQLTSLQVQVKDVMLRRSDLQDLAGFKGLKSLKVESSAGIAPEWILELQAALPNCDITGSPNVQKVIDEARKRQ